MEREEVNAILAGSYTPEGVQRWWDRRRSDLQGRTPAQAWEDGDRAAVKALAQYLAST